RSCAISAEDTGGSLHDRLAALGADLLEDNLPLWWAGRLEPVPQDDARACYAAKLDKGEAELDWRRPARDLERQVRAFDPWPGAETLCQGERLRVWSAALGPAAQGPPGTVQAVSAEGLEVATGDGSLRLLELQLPGRRRQHVREFLNGHPLRPGQRLG
ncbi:MAG TPA: methionyl-tRNA formyltransferase, partial [Pseudohaliea sp.]|nr:methionyl-tRNA formyltransferase [Pseudohaliea sp.]